MGRERTLGGIFLLVWTAGVTALGCGAEPTVQTEEKQSAIVAGTPLTDTIGYVNIAAGPFGGGCSGTLLTPRWVLTAGHCFRTPALVGAIANTSANVTLLGTTAQTNVTEIYIHPNWWNPNVSVSAPPSPTSWNGGYDVALIHLPAPFVATAQFPGKFYNELSNRILDVGDQLLCTGFGYSSVPRGGGGPLLDAILTIDSFPVITGINLYSSPIPMINVSPNSSGQIIYEGDSGGSCYTQSPFSDPYVISATNESVDYANGKDARPTEGHLVYPWYVEPWVDQTMYQAGGGSGLAPSHLAKFTSASVSIPHTGANTTQNILNNFVVATYLGGPANPALTMAPMTAGQPDSWLPYTTLGTTGLPAAVNGSSVISPVGLAATNNGGSPQLYVAAIGTDGQMYVGSFGPNANLVFGSYITNFSGLRWASAGAPSVGFSNATPAIGLASLSRNDYFGLGKDNQIWTRWSNGGVWQSGWMQIPNSPAFQSAPSVGLGWGNLILTAVGTDGQAWVTWLSNGPASGYGGPWIPWFPIGGQFTSGVTIAGWNRGADFYGIGTDFNLYHQSLDNDFWWSGWFQLETGGFFVENLPYGPTATTRTADTHQVDLLVTLVGFAPEILRYPW